MKRQRWTLRFACDVDGGLTSANKALEELDAIKKALADAGYVVLDFRGMCAPMSPQEREQAKP